MTRDEAKTILESLADPVHYRTWSWYGLYMACADGCCSTDYDTVEEALDDIEFYCGGKWGEVR